jgi:hypothetical protein
MIIHWFYQEIIALANHCTKKRSAYAEPHLAKETKRTAKKNNQVTKKDMSNNYRMIKVSFY